MGLDELLQAMLGGGSAGQQRSTGNANSGDPLADMLAGILGGGATSSQQGGGLEDILGGILGGAAGSGNAAGSGRPLPQGTSAGGGLEDILGGILGGAAGSGRPTPQGTSGGGGLMDVISAILGGGQAQQQATPIIEGVSGKTGMSQIIVQMILSFVMSKLLSGAAGGASGMGGLFPGMESDSSASTPGQPAKQGLDLDSLLEQMGQDSGMANELAQQTGLDKGTAQQGLQEVLEALNAQRRGQSSPPSQPKQAGLDELLKDW